MKLPLRISFASMLLPTLLAGLCGCSAAAAKPAVATRPVDTAGTRAASETAALRSFAAQIGVTCESERDVLSCIGGKPEVGDYYDVELHPGCGANGWLASVATSEGAKLRDRIAPLDRRTTAVLSKGQPLCIEAVGRSGGHASYYYVLQLPSGTLECAGNACGDSRTPPARAQAKSSCAIASDGQPNSACATGWIRAEAVKRIDRHQ